MFNSLPTSRISLCTVRQFIKYACLRSRLLNNGKPFGWWLSRNLSAMTYWGGATPDDSYKCACGVNNSCANATYGCNCDKNVKSWLADKGFLTEKSQLPVLQLRFGDTGHKSEKGYHILGKLKCFGQAWISLWLCVLNFPPSSYLTISIWLYLS